MGVVVGRECSEKRGAMAFSEVSRRHQCHETRGGKGETRRGLKSDYIRDPGRRRPLTAAQGEYASRRQLRCDPLALTECEPSEWLSAGGPRGEGRAQKFARQPMLYPS